MEIPTIFIGLVATLLTGIQTVGNEAFDWDKSKATAAIQQEIDKGDYEEANRLYVETQFNPPMPDSDAYRNLDKVRSSIEYYRKYRAALSFEESTDPNKDWNNVINDLTNIPDNFKYRDDVNRLLAKAQQQIHTSVTTQTTNNNQQALIATDPVITCNVGKAGVQQMKKSVCANAFSCEIETGRWYIYTDNQQCRNDQIAYVNSSTSKTTLNPQQQATTHNSIPCATQYGFYYSSSQQACDELRKQAQQMAEQNQKVIDSIRKLDEIGNRKFTVEPITVTLPPQSETKLIIPTPTCVPVGNSNQTICGL